LLFRNSPLAGEVSFQLARSRSDKASLSRNICSDYHGREETIDIAKDGEFIFDDLILCPQLPAKEKAAAQAGAPPIDFSALGSAGGCRRGSLLRALHRHCQEYVTSSSSTTRSRVFRCRPRRTHRPAPRSTSRTRLRCGQWAHRDSGPYASAATAVANDGTGADADADADAGLTDLTEATGSGASGSRVWVSDQDRHRTPARPRPQITDLAKSAGARARPAVRPEPRLAAAANQSEPEDSDNEDKDDGNWERRVGRRDQPPRGASAASTPW
jgi:hypothetical protein